VTLVSVPPQPANHAQDGFWGLSFGGATGWQQRRRADSRAGAPRPAAVDRAGGCPALGADRHERTEERSGYRNGSRPCLLTTQVGDIPLSIPKLRSGSFFPRILEPRRRIDQALYAVIMEAWSRASPPAYLAVGQPARGTRSFFVRSEQHPWKHNTAAVRQYR
jgi:hypothetical protein